MNVVFSCQDGRNDQVKSRVFVAVILGVCAFLFAARAESTGSKQTLPETTPAPSHGPVLMAAGSGSSAGSSSGRTRRSPVTRLPAPELSVEEWIQGSKTTLAALRGKVVLLDFFQIICPGCRSVHPHIVEMQRRYGSQGLQVLGIAVAFELQRLQTPSKIRAYVKDNEFNYPVAIDRGLTDTFVAYHARGTPYVALIDRAGNIRALDFYRPDAVEEAVKTLLREGGSRG